MKSKITLLLVGALALFSIGSFITAQQSGSGVPGGSSFSTQFKSSATVFGGAGPGTAGQVLTSNGASAAPTFQAGSSVTPAALTKADDTNVTLTLGGTPATALLQATSITAGWTGRLAFSRFTQGSALSVLGVTGNAGADFASIAAATDGNVLRRAGTALTFGSLDLTAAGTVGSSILGVANGGTNLAAATDDNVMVGNGTTWQSKAITSCSAATSALTYNTTTNAWGCNTLSGGITVVASGTSSISWDDACTTTPTQPYSYVVTSDNRVSIVLGPMSPTTCTSDSVNFRATSTSTLPASIRPTANQYITGVYARDNGGNSTGCMGFATTGILDAVPNNTSGCPGPSWTNTGVKSIGFDRTVSLFYMLQ